MDDVEVYILVACLVLLAFVALSLGVYFCKQKYRHGQQYILPFSIHGDQTIDETDSRSRHKVRILDLHGHSVEDAMSTVKTTINEMRSSGKANNLNIITGKGLHSKDGIPKIRPAVKSYLDKENMRYKWVNDGMVALKVPPHTKEYG